MGLAEELADEVARIFRDSWSMRDGRVVPDTDKLVFKNEGVKLDAAVLYADLASSTLLVDSQSSTLAAEVYKAYLYCAAKIVRNVDGEITAYDGDRIMAVFVGLWRHEHAVLATLRLNRVIGEIINPAFSRVYTTISYRLRHSVGIDSSPLMAVKTGIRDANDLVWIGRAANYAAKLSAQRSSSNSIYITKVVYDNLGETFRQFEGQKVWQETIWNEITPMTICRSDWSCGLAARGESGRR
ncbi:MAG TPA: adenylate/guanylate cyclase domain-containing protein [Terriglobales bacterium]